MLFNEPKKNGYRQGLLAVAILVFCLSVSLHAQAPVLNPEQTVDVSTGQMGFGLPLGTVNGKGLAYPLRLSYEAGIHYDQEASDAGLGFGLNIGCITRNVVNVPDDNVGPYSYSGAMPLHCEDAFVPATVLKFATDASMSIIGMVVPYAGIALDVISGIGKFLDASSSSPSDFRTGIYEYDWAHNTGVGFFKGGQATDYPDIYFVSTPFISGQLIWVGEAGTGHFVFKTTGGSSKKGDETVKVEYIYANGFTNEVFRIRLTDGSMLVFKKMDLGGNATSVWPYGAAEVEAGKYCWYLGKILRQTDASPTTWWLTAVLGPDYVDGGGNSDDPLDASANLNKGKWIGLTYNPIAVDRRQCFVDMDMQTSETTTSTAFYGNNADKILQQIATIETANEKAEFVYSDSTVEPRLDRLYIYSESGAVNFRKFPCLKGVRFLTKNNEQKSNVTFQTNYTLRPGSHHSFTDAVSASERTSSGYISAPVNNPSAACLTLNSVSWQGSGGTEPQTVKFHYGKNPDAAVHIGHPQSTDPIMQEFMGYYLFTHVEQKDVWGYYCANPATPYNITNAEGDYSKAVNADAWSIDSISMPNGMAIKWEFEPNRFDRANGEFVTSNNAASSPKPPKYGGGIRVKSVTAYNGLGKKEKTSYFYTNTSGTFSEDNGNSSGYISAEPKDYIHMADNRPMPAKGGIYTPSSVCYEKVQVVKGYSTTVPHAPYGYTVYNYTHAGDPAMPGYFPNEGMFGQIDCSWKRGTLNSVAVYEKNGKLIDSTCMDNSLIDFDGTEGEWIDFDIEESRANGFATYGWVRQDSIVSLKNGVRNKTAKKYGDVTATSDDHISFVINKKNIINPRSVPEIPWYTVVDYPKYTRTATMTGIGGDPNNAIIFIAQGEYTTTVVKDDDVKVQAIHNVDLGANELSDAQWSAVEEFSSSCNNNDAGWLLTGLDVIAYDDASKNDLLFQFVGMDYVKLLIWPNVQISGNTIVHDTPLFLRVMNGTRDAVDFTSSALVSSYGWGSPIVFSGSPNSYDVIPNTSCVCNLENSSNTIDILFYFSDPGYASFTRIFNASNSNKHMFFIIQDIDLHNQTDWTEFGGTPIKKVPYNLSKSIADVPTIQGGGRYPFIGPHATVVALDADNKQNDWIATDFYYDESEGRCYIEDAVIKDLQVQTSPFQLQYSLDGTLGKRTKTLKPESYKFLSHFNLPFKSQTTVCGIVPIGDLTRRIYPFTIPGINSAFIKTELLSIYGNFTIAGDLDGQPNEIWQEAPKDKYLISKTIPAYWNYDAMKTANMLTPSCQSIAYEKAVGDATPLSATDVRTSQATTWSPYLGSFAWVPNYSYSWNDDKGAYSDFVFPASSNPPTDPTSSNPHWQLTGTAVKYDAFSTSIETKNAKGIYNTSVYRNDVHLPLGSVVNASIFECGVFTGDYDKNEAVTGYFSYFDKENGWEKHFGTVVDVPANRLHFGQKVLKIENGEGAMRNFKIRANTPYEASVWAYVESGSGNGFYLNAEIHSGIAPTDPWPVTWQNLPAVLTTKTSDKFTSTNGKWQLVKVMIPAQADPGSGNELWIRLTVGKNGETFLAYVDDIRFAPAKALVTSTYYDQLWHQPILSVDANNNPSQKVVYDDFGRPIEWYKIDKSNPVNATLLQSKKYHLMSDWSTPEPNKWYKIVSELNENYCIDILNQTWVDGQLIQLWTYAGTSNQQWKFVSTGDGYYQIVSRGGTTFGIDDPYGNITNGTQLKIWTLGGDNQKWKFTDAGGGCCRIAAKAGASAYIDLENGTVANGTKLQIWQNGANSKWKMVEVP